MNSTVDFITFTHPAHIERLQGQIAGIVATHKHDFNKIILIRQRCRGQFDNIHFDGVMEVESEDHPNILTEYGLPEDDPVADEYTHGPTACHYWKWHVINHLIGMKVSKADFVVFSDDDCYIKHSTPKRSWVVEGIDLLRQHSDILIVSPSDGGDMAEKRIGSVRLTRNVSQQLFLANRLRLRAINFNIPWNWEKLAPGQPFQEYYYMLEGRIWRYMDAYGLWRAILPAEWRYWHGQW